MAKKWTDEQLKAIELRTGIYLCQPPQVQERQRFLLNELSI
jgi:hypothetical protein